MDEVGETISEQPIFAGEPASPAFSPEPIPRAMISPFHLDVSVDTPRTDLVIRDQTSRLYQTRRNGDWRDRDSRGA
jgi:hypothetical protein